jgi:hypothetical protein
MRQVIRGTLLAATLVLACEASALTPAEKCESAKLKEAGKYGFCRLRAETKAIKTGRPPDYSKCDEKFAFKWPTIESAGSGMCPSNGEQTALASFIIQHTDDVSAALAGGPLPECLRSTLPTGQTTSYGVGSDGDSQSGASRFFTDNGDGTITDETTGLMWEKKSDDGTIHDKDNLYSWGMLSSPYTMNGTIVTFLATLNGGGGFAGHTDWRIPNPNELESLRNLESVAPATFSAFNTNCTANCTVTTCSCTYMGPSSIWSSVYWSSATNQHSPFRAYAVNFFDGHLVSDLKTLNNLARAVRGGS